METNSKTAADEVKISAEEVEELMTEYFAEYVPDIELPDWHDFPEPEDDSMEETTKGEIDRGAIGATKKTKTA